MERSKIVEVFFEVGLFGQQTVVASSAQMLRLDVGHDWVLERTNSCAFRYRAPCKEALAFMGGLLDFNKIHTESIGRCGHNIDDWILRRFEGDLYVCHGTVATKLA